MAIHTTTLVCLFLVTYKTTHAMDAMIHRQVSEMGRAALNLQQQSVQGNRGQTRMQREHLINENSISHDTEDTIMEQMFMVGNRGVIPRSKRDNGKISQFGKVMPKKNNESKERIVIELLEDFRYLDSSMSFSMSYIDQPHHKSSHSTSVDKSTPKRSSALKKHENVSSPKGRANSSTGEVKLIPTESDTSESAVESVEESVASVSTTDENVKSTSRWLVIAGTVSLASVVIALAVFLGLRYRVSSQNKTSHEIQDDSEYTNKV